ncbi:hypothetical protein BHM03_00056533 [Ensete ventricosum]|nr:hypothetical protein BHM03_00056533 [Ensete ventricosum]
MVSGKRESYDERGKREEKGLCDGKDEEEERDTGRSHRLPTERKPQHPPFAEENAAAIRTRLGRCRRCCRLSRSLRRNQFHRGN